MCRPPPSFWLPQRPAPYPVALLTTPSFLNPCFKADRKSPCRAQPLSAARHAEVTSPSRKCQVSLWEHHHSQTLGPSGLHIRREDGQVTPGISFQGTSAPRPLGAGAPSSQAAYPPALPRPPSGPGPPPSWASSQGPSPSRAGEVGSPWSWTGGPLPVSQGLLASLCSSVKLGSTRAFLQQLWRVHTHPAWTTVRVSGRETC